MNNFTNFLQTMHRFFHSLWNCAPNLNISLYPLCCIEVKAYIENSDELMQDLHQILLDLNRVSKELLE